MAQRITIDKSLLDFSHIIRILKIVWECTPGLTIAKFSITFFNALLPLAPWFLMGFLLDEMNKPSPSKDLLIWILVGFFTVKLLTIILSQISAYVNLLQSDIIADHMSEIVISKTLTTDMEYFDSDVYHDIFQRAIASSSGRPLQVLMAFTSLFQNVITVVGALIALVAYVHWGIIPILILIAIPVTVIRWYFTNQMVDLREEQTQKDRKAGYFKGILTSNIFAQEVRIFNFGPKLLRQFLSLRWDLRKEKRLLYLKQTRSIGMAQSIESLAIISALGLICYQALNKAISIGGIAMAYGVFQKAQSSIAGVLKSFVTIHENRRYLEHLFTFLDLETKILDPANPLPAPERIEKISFENVSFTYPKTNKLVIDDLSFEIKRGQILAIVGENGCGKTTLVKLLTRLYQKDQGSIKVDDIDIEDITLADLRKKFTVIFQMFAKYNATVTENVQFADMNSQLEVDRIKEAVGLAHAEKFVKKLPDQYRTQLGRSFHAGEELSGGQWQKIALSRAFYKDADVIVLDEPTSFIDPIAEEDIFASLRKVAEDKILILITHRIYNLKMADKIIVMDQGQIVEAGNHNELMAQNGLFKEMFDKQS